MPRASRTTRTIHALAAVMMAGLGGCTTSAGYFYGEYQSDPEIQTGRSYEGRVFTDASDGIGGETCRVVTARHQDRLGNITSREETVCDQF
jgi:hypothetical protein